MFTSKERVERGGFLVAYESEVMSDGEAQRRGLLDPGAAPAEDGATLHVGADAAIDPPIDEVWADAAGMSLDECRALWAENPSAVLDAIKANLLPGKDATENVRKYEPFEVVDKDASDAELEAENAELKGESEQKEAKPSKADLRAECEARGIKAPKNATVAQLEALLGD